MGYICVYVLFFLQRKEENEREREREKKERQRTPRFHIHFYRNRQAKPFRPPALNPKRGCNTDRKLLLQQTIKNLSTTELLSSYFTVCYVNEN